MSNSFGGGTSSGSRSVTARPEAMWAANNFTDYLKSLTIPIKTLPTTLTNCRLSCPTTFTAWTAPTPRASGWKTPYIIRRRAD